MQRTTMSLGNPECQRRKDESSFPGRRLEHVRQSLQCQLRVSLKAVIPVRDRAVVDRSSCVLKRLHTAGPGCRPVASELESNRGGLLPGLGRALDDDEILEWWSRKLHRIALCAVFFVALIILGIPFWKAAGSHLAR